MQLVYVYAMRLPLLATVVWNMFATHAKSYRVKKIKMPESEGLIYFFYTFFEMCHTQRHENDKRDL